MRKIIHLLLLALMVGCSSTARYETISISGSDTMYELMEILSAVYMKKNPELSIYVSGGGTEFGFHSLEKGTADICMASRNLNSGELRIIADKFKSVGVSHIIAKDAISIYVNQENPIQNLKQDIIYQIYKCGFDSWNQLGGDNAKIVALRRMSTSGTYHYFQDHILNGEDFCEKIESVNTHEEMIDYVENDKYAIGFGGVGNHGNAKLLKIEDYEPTPDNIKNDKYPLTRYLKLITISEPKGRVRDFINWILGPEGQKIIRNFGYVSLY